MNELILLRVLLFISVFALSFMVYFYYKVSEQKDQFAQALEETLETYFDLWDTYSLQKIIFAQAGEELKKLKKLLNIDE